LPALKGGKAFCCNSFLEKQNKTKQKKKIHNGKLSPSLSATASEQKTVLRAALTTVHAGEKILRCTEQICRVYH
jgi:hypothetical protein